MHKLENKTSEKARMARPTVQDVGRNKTTRRQQGWVCSRSHGLRGNAVQGALRRVRTSVSYAGSQARRG